MARIILFEGRRISVPDDTTDDEVRQILSAPVPAASSPPAVIGAAVQKEQKAPPTSDVTLPLPPGAGRVGFSNAAPALTPDEADYKPAGYNQGLDYVDNTAAGFLSGARKGVAAVVGAPVDLVNAAPMLANLIPGVDGVGPISPNPIGGSNTMESILGLGGIIPEVPEPQDMLQRIVNRAGYEVGASAVPVVGAMGKAASMAPQSVRAIASNPQNLGQAFGGQVLEAAAANPTAFAKREAVGALAAGLGAGTANEAFGNEQFGTDNFWSDFLGSVAGAGALGAGSAVTGMARNMYAGATGNPAYMDNVAGQEVANRIINNSSDLQQQAARLQAAGLPPQRLDTHEIVELLRRPAAVEEVIPGYRANIGDRTQDPGLATFAYNQDAVSPGAANARRVGNETVINERMNGLEPGGDPARLRASLQSSVDQEIAQRVSEEELARAIFGHAAQQVLPSMPDATARGSSIRAALQDVYDAEGQRVSELYAPINEATVPVDVAPLRDQFANIDQNLPLNDRDRFRPAEANVPARLAPPVPQATLQPVNTGLLDERGRPILRPAVAPEPADTRVPLNEITSMRSGLTDDIRAQRAQGQRQAARVGDQYLTSIDDFTEQVIPPELQIRLDQARSARRDVAERFERPGTAIAETLKRREGGGYQMDDSAIPGRFAQTDQGRLNDLRALLSEAGTDPRVRGGLADEVLADVQTRGLIERPDQLQRYLSERNVLLGEFPELRTRLDTAGMTRRQLAEAERATQTTTRDLTTPGRTATASYLRFGDESVGDAIRTVTASPRPREAVQELLTRASTPEARQDLRSALWTEVRRRGSEQAPGMTGEQRWNGKRLRDMFNDTKIAAVADELWADSPDDLADIKQVFEALATSEGSTRARAANTSGTAQSLSGKYDPSLSAASIASRARSVNRGVVSLPITMVDIVATWLRGRSAQVQSRAIDTLASAVVNNPGMAADLLEKYNPATAAARRRMITQKYGVRGTQILNLLDGAEAEEDPVLEAVGAN